MFSNYTSSDCLDNGNNKKAIQEADKVLKKQKDLQCAKVIQLIPLYRNPDNGDFRLFATFHLAPVLFLFPQCKILWIIGTLIKDIFGLF